MYKERFWQLGSASEAPPATTGHQANKVKASLALVERHVLQTEWAAVAAVQMALGIRLGVAALVTTALDSQGNQVAAAFASVAAGTVKALPISRASSSAVAA